MKVMNLLLNGSENEKCTSMSTTVPLVYSYISVHNMNSEVFAVYRCRMPMEDSLCLMRPTLPSLFLLCWMDTLQICTTTSHSSLAVRRLSLGPGSSLHVEARSCPSYQKETEGTNLTRENHNKPTDLCFEFSWRSECLQTYQICPTKLWECV